MMFSETYVRWMFCDYVARRTTMDGTVAIKPFQGSAPWVRRYGHVLTLVVLAILACLIRFN